jgi:hypothetical protein
MCSRPGNPPFLVGVKRRSEKMRRENLHKVILMLIVLCALDNVTFIANFLFTLEIIHS